MLRNHEGPRLLIAGGQAREACSVVPFGTLVHASLCGSMLLMGLSPTEIRYCHV